MRDLAIALLDDEDGINDKAYVILRELLVVEGGNNDLLGAVKAADGRWYLPEDRVKILRGTTSMAWETTQDDLRTVLQRHNVVVSDDRLEELHDGIDHAAIEAGVLHCTDMDDQTSSMLSDLEDQLIQIGVLAGVEKKFTGS